MFFDSPTGGPGRGIWPSHANIVRPCVNRSGAAYSKGDVVMLDLAATSTELTTSDSNTYLPGDNSVFDTIIDATTAAIQDGGIFGVVVESGGIADNEVGDVQFYGIVDECSVLDSSAAGSAPGTALVPINASQSLDGQPAAGEIIVGIYLSPQDSSLTNAELKRVLFNGFALPIMNHG